MNRKSSIHFKPVRNVRFAVSHAERTDLSEPAYLLPKEHQLANVVIAGSLSENELAALFIKQKEGMTGQAKARGSSPFWEGVLVLADTDSKAKTANLQVWKKEYEKATGHKVLHMSVHLDEGYIDALGKPQYNPHAHVIVSRMDSKNRVIKLERKELAAVQDLTAVALKMERGSTLEERQGKRGRAHIPHREFREIADGARLGLDKEKSKTARIQKLFAADTPIIDGLKKELADSKAQAAQLQEQYRLARQALKDSGEAKQADYQALKKTHEAALAALSKLTEKVETMTQANKDLQAKNDELAAEVARAAKYAAMADNYQADLAAGTPAHLIMPRTAPLPSPSKPNPAEQVPPVPMAPKATKTAVEPPKAKTLPIPQPEPQKSLVERLEASLKAFLDWVKVKGGVVMEVDTQQSQHFGPVVQLDDLHAVQSTGRGKYAVHELSKLDRVPVQDDPKTEIRYQGGLGQVRGRGVGKGGHGD